MKKFIISLMAVIFISSSSQLVFATENNNQVILNSKPEIIIHTEYDYEIESFKEITQGFGRCFVKWVEIELKVYTGSIDIIPIEQKISVMYDGIWYTGVVTSTGVGYNAINGTWKGIFKGMLVANC